MKRSALSSRGDILKAVDVELTGAVVVRLYRLNKRLPAPLLDRYVKRPSRARSKYKCKQSHYAHYEKKALPNARKRIERLHTVDILSDPFGTVIFNYQESALIVSRDDVFSGLTSMEKNRDQFSTPRKKACEPVFFNHTIIVFFCRLHCQAPQIISSTTCIPRTRRPSRLQETEK
ncbi:hypothetical protein AcV7_004600 [Taiwanofungus camphoratus]|nr:hypothetical protein AcV7_004600 [Antrodia cinnamomea]